MHYIDLTVKSPKGGYGSVQFTVDGDDISEQVKLNVDLLIKAISTVRVGYLEGPKDE